MTRIGGLRTAAWHGDRVLDLEFPEEWDVTVHWPHTPPPLADDAIRAALERPVGQLPIRELCRAKTRPVVIVDDLCRPTPAWRVMPFLLEQFRQGGIPAKQVTIVMATGTHGVTSPDWMAKKVGPEAAAHCRLEVHDSRRRGVRLGTTRHGTPVVTNREVAASDFLVGIGGVYPSGNTGFGGGAKLALGVLTFGSVAWLHNRHADVGWGVAAQRSSFREDLEAISRLLKLNTVLTLHLDHNRKVVRIASGDHYRYVPEEVAFARRTFAAALPGDADVVVCNAYPNDVSLTFARSKGMAAFAHAGTGASKIAVAACSEGPGVHGLFPLAGSPRFHAQRVLARRLAALGPGQAAAAVGRRLLGALRAPSRPRKTSAPPQRATGPGSPIWLYRTVEGAAELPLVNGLQVRTSWTEVIAAVRTEQTGRRKLRVALYPCAPLQCFEALSAEDELAGVSARAPQTDLSP